MELRYHANDNIIAQIQERTQIANGADIGRESLAFFNWGVAEAEAGRRIISIDESGNQTVWPMMDIIERSR